jgi:serpin B
MAPMPRRRLAPLLAAALLACSGSGGGAPADVADPPEILHGTIKARDRSGKAAGADFTAVVAGNTAFAVDAYRALRVASPGKNLALGAYSVSQVLGMLYAGARGVTADEMKKALRWDLPPERAHVAMNALDLELRTRAEDVTLAIANRVFAQRGTALLPSYLDVLTRDYGAPLAVADFAADAEASRATINDWVRRVTVGKIPQLFPAGTIRGNTKVVLVNAMYLDAPWKYRFDPASTRRAPFSLPGGERVEVDTMRFDEFLPSGRGDDWVAVELPYRGDELSMLIVAPRDLDAFEAALTPARLAEIAAQVKPGGIHLSLPKFTFSFHTSLVDTLEALGMGSLFRGGDLSGMTGAPGLAVDAVEHETFLDVDEAGTKAAAATGAAIADSHGPTVVIDRPFLFVVRDRPTGAVLFLGRVVDPRPAGK